MENVDGGAGGQRIINLILFDYRPNVVAIRVLLFELFHCGKRTTNESDEKPKKRILRTSEFMNVCAVRARATIATSLYLFSPLLFALNTQPEAAALLLCSLLTAKANRSFNIFGRLL